MYALVAIIARHGRQFKLISDFFYKILNLLTFYSKILFYSEVYNLFYFILYRSFWAMFRMSKHCIECLICR